MLQRYPYYTFLAVFAEVYKLDTCTYILKRQVSIRVLSVLERCPYSTDLHVYRRVYWKFAHITKGVSICLY